MKENLYVNVHAIQTVPPCCINRDDTGAPKTAIYGDKVRARVSSQCWKRATRKYFMENNQEWDMAVRTRCVPTMIAEDIQKLDSEISEKDALALAGTVITAAGIGKIDAKAESKKKDNDDKDDEQEKETAANVNALFFISRKQTEELAKIAIRYKKEKEDIEKNCDKKEIKKQIADLDKQMKKEAELAAKENPTIDMALFGRMAASNPTLGYDAAVQYAHPISTHEVANEFDFFAAVDEYLPEGAAGAAHIDTSEFNSFTMYRNATLNVKELAKSLKEDTAKAVRDFVEAFVLSMPTGKQNSFANNTLPDAVYVTINRDMPVSLSGAFEKAITADGDGYVNKSVRAMMEYAAERNEDYGAPAVSLAVGRRMKEYDGIEVSSLNNILSRLEEEIGKELNREVI